jgi:hypothetical protein
MQALVTGDVLSDLLNGLDEGVFSLQVAWGTEGAAGYGISEPLEIVVVNAYVRMGDELPDPTGDAAWVLLKETFPQGTPDEVERTLEFDLGGGGVTDHGELTGLEDDDHPQYLNEDRGDARYAPVGALVDGDTVGFLLFQNGGVRLLDAEGDRFLQVGFNQSLSANRVLFFAVNDANRTINLSGDLTVAAAATVSGTNTGDVTLAGVPDYLTRVGQVITRALINLASHVTGILGRANGGTGLSAAGAAGNVLTSDGTNWTSAAGLNGSVGATTPAAGTFTTLDAIAFGAALEREMVKPATWQIPWRADYGTPTTTGSGAATASNWAVNCQTGTTVSSRAQRALLTPSVTDSFTAGPNVDSRVIDWSKRVTVGFALNLVSASTNGQVFIRMGNNCSTSGNLSGRGMGIRINNTTLVAQCHDGTTLNTSATLKTNTAGTSTATVIVLQSGGAGNVAVYVDNVLAATLTGGPTAAGFAGDFLAVEALNNADASSTRVHVSPIKFYTTF